MEPAAPDPGDPGPDGGGGLGVEVVVVEPGDPPGDGPGLWQKAGKKTQRLPPMLPKLPPALPKLPPKKNLEDGSGAAATRPTANRTTGHRIQERYKKNSVYLIQKRMIFSSTDKCAR